MVPIYYDVMKNDFYYYSTYGLRIRSQIKLPGITELRSASGSSVDVKISFAEITASVLDKFFPDTPIHKAPGCDVRVTEQAMCFDYWDDATILVSDGS